MTALQKELLAGRFEILREIGRGAAGVVFRAIDVQSAEATALKIIAAGADATSEHLRFLREGEVLERLVHPGIVRVLGYGALDAGYNDGFRTLHPDVKGYTFPTWDPHVRLDYMFVPRAFRERLQAVEVITEPKERIRAASDHCPLLGVLAMD